MVNMSPDTEMPRSGTIEPESDALENIIFDDVVSGVSPGTIKPDLRFELTWESEDVTGDFIREVANRMLLGYKAIIQTGGKLGQSYYMHVLDLVFLFERLQAVVKLTEVERRCVYCACAVHDLNKVPPYNHRSGGRHTYADQASEANIATELDRLEIDRFFPAWREYLADIVHLAHLHQGNLAITTAGLDRTQHRRLQLGWERVQRIGWLMYAVDTLATSHTLSETRSKAQALDKINLFLNDRPHHWLIHRVAEQRGLLTNLIHTAVVARLREDADAVDLLYYPDGVAYLVRHDSPFVWSEERVTDVATHVQQRLASIQKEDIGKFVKTTSWGIDVDSAALESGAGVSDIFEVIVSRVQAKQYKADWRTQREVGITTDLRLAESSSKLGTTASVYIAERLHAGTLVPVEPEKFRLGDLVMAYRNYLNKHAAARLKAAKLRNGEERVYVLLELPKERWPAYGAVNSYRWGYFLAVDCTLSLDELHDAILADLADLHSEPMQYALAPPNSMATSVLDTYLRETLAVTGPTVPRAHYGAHLSRYVNGQHRQCSVCSGVAPTQEWMAANAPGSIGVQIFSNRLEGGSDHEPKRYICPVCRIQFILERLAWKSHRDRQGKEQTTFYLHLFPYSFFSRPLLTSWYAEVQRLRGQDLGSFFIKTDEVFRNWAANDSIPIQGISGGTIGVALPELAEALSNTPLLPMHARGQGYGEQFLQALETAVILARFFGCRALLSRLPVPILDLATVPEIALFVEGMPRNMGWLVTGARGGADGERSALDTRAVQNLLQRLGHLHAIKQHLWYAGYKGDMVHELATSMHDDALGIYGTADRLIEKKVAKGVGRSADWQAVRLAHDLGPHLQALVASHHSNGSTKNGG